MTIRNLKSGAMVRRTVRGARGIASFFAIAALIGLLRADAASAQRSLTSVLLPTDSSGAKKLNAVPAALKPRKSGFAKVQMQNSRVFRASYEKRFEIRKLFRDRGLEYPAAEIFLRVFKREQQLEMWVRPAAQDSFVLLKTYDICALNEAPGPKRLKGDLKTPEGFYYIESFNPQSGYHLSLRLNYPNESDRILGGAQQLGGDIFVHGGCKTAGCMALTDEGIKEVYVLAMEARDNGQQRIPVHIFPARLSDDNLRNLIRVFEKEKPDLVGFWANLKTGYDFFESGHKTPVVSVNERGRYVYESADKRTLLGSPAPVVAEQR